VILSLWVGWLRIGLFGFGGGPSVIPLMRAECVGRAWMTDAQFLDALALGNALPGPIAVKMAVAIGNHAAGWFGAVVALVGLCLPGVALMVGLAALFSRFREHPSVGGMLKGARAAVVGMVPDGVRDLRGGMVAAGALILLLMQVHPAWVIALALAIGAFFR
jgi:chromate transporter